jgi:hypothetical protein
MMMMQLLEPTDTPRTDEFSSNEISESLNFKK